MKQGWEIKKLGEIATYINGYAFKPEHWEEEGLPIIRIQNLNNPNAEFNYCSLDIPDKYVVNNGDILISWSASLGVYEWNQGKAYLNQHIFKVLFNKIDINKFFFKYAIGAKIKDMIKNAHGATMKHIVKGDFDNTAIPVPPLPVQEQIVSELDLLSGIIEKKREQLKELDALAQSIFYDMFGDPITNEKGWEVKKLGEVCESVSYGTSNSSTENGEYKYLRMNNITYSGHIDITDIKYIDISDDEYEKYVVRKGDILFNRTNSKDLVGKTALFNFEEEMIIAGYIIRVRVNQDSIIPTFVVKWLNTPLMKSYFKNICKGAVNQSNINSKELKNIPISIPPLPLQHQFATKIEAIEKQKELIKQSISETETLFNERMQHYFN